MAVPALAGLDLLATAIVIVDQSLVVRYANPAAENLFEVSSKSFVGQTIAEIFDNDRVLAAAIDYARTNDCSYTEHDLKIGAAGRAKLHLSCTLSPVEIEGWVAGWSGLALEFRHIEQQLKIAREERMQDQNQANRELIRNLAHEIKNPLGGLRGAAQLLERELKDTALREYTNVIIGEADRLANLVDSMLGPGRAPRRESLNLHELCEHVYHLLRSEGGTRVVVDRDYDPSLPTIAVDRHLVIQAMLNLGRNALQAVGNQGRITLRTRALTHASIGSVRYRLVASIEFEDNGPGVPEALRDSLFYPLVTGRPDGTGLGLAIAQDLVTRHGGLIEFESEAGRTVFTILLPIANESP